MNKKVLLCVTLVLLDLAFLKVSGIKAENFEKEEMLFMEIPSVVTASKKAESIQEAPAIVTVITADQIKDFGANTFYDILQRMPSIQPVGTHLYPRNTAVIRGDLIGPYDNHVLILINGRPFRDDVSGGLNASFYNMFPVEAIERIEFVRGPGSVLYGTNAFDGVINIITKKPVKDVEAEITAGAGSFGANIGRGSFGFKKNDLNLLANVNYFKDDGWDYRAISCSPTGGAQYDGSTKYGNNNASGFLSFQYKGFTFNSYIANLEQKNFGLAPMWQSVGTDGASWLVTTRRFADLGYSKQLFDDYNFQANVTYNYYDFRSYSKNAFASTEGAYDFLGEISLGGPVLENVSFIVGGVFTQLSRSDSLDISKAKIPDFEKSDYSVYLQVNYKPVQKMKLVGGLQYNKPQDVDGVTVPRIGAIYQISDKLASKLSYAEAFREPWPIETLTYYPGVLVGNPLLKPEIVSTIDMQLTYSDKKHQSSLTIFTNSYKDLITRVAHPTIPATSSYDNIGKMEIQGIEIESKVLLLSNLYMEGSGTYQTEKENKVLTPDYIVKLGFSYRSDFGLVLGIFDNYFGEPKKNKGAVLNPEATAIHIISVNVKYQIPYTKSLEINIFAQNVLDQNYYFPEFSKGWVNTLPLEPGRAIYSTVSYKF